MKNILNKILIPLCLFIMIITISNKVNAESFSSNKNSVTIGENFTITISGINGKVTVSSNDKVSLSKTGTMWVTGSIAISGTAKKEGTGTITIKLVDATNTGANPKDLSGTTKNINITVKKKEEEKQEQTSSNQSKPSTTNNTQNSNKKTNNTNNKTNQTKKTETKKETTVVETKEKEEATPEWGIASIILTAIKDNGEKTNIELDKKFDINVYDYSCTVDSDVRTIQLQPEAYEYNDFITITGLDKDLQEGENIVSLKLAKNGQKELNYIIKVNKTKQEEAEVLKEEPEVLAATLPCSEITSQICLPIWGFVLIELITILVTICVTILFLKKVVLNKNIKKEQEG